MEDTKTQTVIGTNMADADLALKELGETTLVREPLSAEEDRRILKNIDMWYVFQLALYIEPKLLSVCQPTASYDAFLLIPIPRQIGNGIHFNPRSSN